jgi:hypothetical protein
MEKVEVNEGIAQSKCRRTYRGLLGSGRRGARFSRCSVTGSALEGDAARLTDIVQPDAIHVELIVHHIALFSVSNSGPDTWVVVPGWYVLPCR